MPYVNSNQASQAALGKRSVPVDARGELPGSGGKQHAVVFSQHQGRNSLGKFRQNRNERQELALAQREALTNQDSSATPVAA